MTLASCDPVTVVQVGLDDVVLLRITPDSAGLGIAHTLQLRALPLDETGAFLPGLPVEWSTLSQTVATVDETGVATGVAAGRAEIVATVSGHSATAVLDVDQAAAIVLSEVSVDFTAAVGGPDPAPASVEVTNGGALPLVELAVDSIVYGPDADDWLAAGLSAEGAPATLTLTPSTGDVTTAGTYTATVWISAERADNSPASVVATLEITEGGSSSLSAAASPGSAGALRVGSPLTRPPRTHSGAVRSRRTGARSWPHPRPEDDPVARPSPRR